MRDICTWSQAETFSTFIITEYRVHTKVIIPPLTLSGKSLTLVSFTSKLAKFEVFWRPTFSHKTSPSKTIYSIHINVKYTPVLFITFFEILQKLSINPTARIWLLKNLCWLRAHLSKHYPTAHITRTTVAFKQNLLWDDICSYKARFKEEINDFNDRCCVVSLTEEKHLSY